MIRVKSEASPLGYFSIHACESSYTYVNAAYVEAYLLSAFKPLLLNDYLSHVASEAGGDLCIKGASSLQVRPATLLFLATVRHSLFSQKRNLGTMYWGKRFSHKYNTHVLPRTRNANPFGFNKAISGLMALATGLN